MKKSILLLLTTLLFFACKEDEEKPPFNNQEFYENHQAANWTKETAREHLQGRWELVYTYCCPEASSNEWLAVEDDSFLLELKAIVLKSLTIMNSKKSSFGILMIAMKMLFI